MIHYKACAKTRKEKLADIALMIFGFVAALYTTVQTIRVSSLDLDLGLVHDD
jgi:proton-coupled amino acid transporter